MSQSNFGNLESPLNGTNFFNTYLEPWRDALHTMHSGSSRPSYAVAGTQWLDTTTTPWAVKVFDGTQDISLGTINATTDFFTPANAALSTNPTLNGTISGSAAPKLNNFRLTLTSNVPVTTTDVTGASTLYLTPYNGNQIALYTSGQWVLLTSTQVSLALSGLTNNTLYDVFAYNNAGTVTLETAAWSNSGAGTSARATALAYQDGVLVRSGDVTRRYLGTFRSTGTTTTEDSAAKRFLYNYGSRIQRRLTANDSTASWTYTTATWRAANNNTTDGVGRASFVIGVAEDAISINRVSISANTANGQTSGGIGLNSTSANNADVTAFQTTTNVVGTNASFFGVPSVGFNFVQSVEWSQAVGTSTFYGEIISGIKSGIAGTILA